VQPRLTRLDLLGRRLTGSVVFVEGNAGDKVCQTVDEIPTDFGFCFTDDLVQEMTSGTVEGQAENVLADTGGFSDQEQIGGEVASPEHYLFPILV
jgi:hypothetical protein